MRPLNLKIRTTTILSLFCTVIGVLYSSFSAAAATATATITAVVLTPISITKTSDLSFGDVYPDVTSPGTITIDVGSNRTAAGAATLGPTAGTAAQFTVAGQANASYVISLPSTAVSLTSPSNDTMSVDSFTSDGTGTLGAGGTQIVDVGATLHVAAQQAPGSYSGTFDITVNYN